MTPLPEPGLVDLIGLILGGLAVAALAAWLAAVLMRPDR
jgi:hypothetical protein